MPISVVYRTDLQRFADQGTAASAPEEPSPLVLYGYGSYEASIDPYFSVSRLSLLDRGVVFAIAHVRGGGEMGRHWYDQGKTTAKKNTFTDFIAAAHHLVDAGWTRPDRWWPPADRPADCSWARSRTWLPSSSLESARTCPSSTL